MAMIEGSGMKGCVGKMAAIASGSIRFGLGIWGRSMGPRPLGAIWGAEPEF